jgi:hypothetical protein
MIERRPKATAIWVALALFSKEEAVLLPLMFVIWESMASVPTDQSDRSRWLTPMCSVLSLGGYALLRLWSGAFWIGNAPDFYRPIQTFGQFVRNVLEYADRSSTFATVSLLLAFVCARRWAPIETDDRHRLRLALAWVICGFGITAFLPVRSSLYAVMPSVGVSLAAATLIMHVTRPFTVSQRLRLWAGYLVILTTLLPVYWSRNLRWTSLAELSQQAIAEVQSHVRSNTRVVNVTVAERQISRVHLGNAWGTLLPEISDIYFDGQIILRVVPFSSLVDGMPNSESIQKPFVVLDDRAIRINKAPQVQ